MKEIKLRIIGNGSDDEPFRPDCVLGVTHKEGDIIISEIEVDNRGKPKEREVEVTILEKGADFP